MNKETGQQPATADQEEARLREELQSGERLVLASQLISFKGKIDSVTLTAFKEHAKLITSKGRLTKSDQAWLDDYIENLPELYDLMKIGDATTDMSENDGMVAPETLQLAQVRDKEIPRIKLNELVIKPVSFDGTRPSPRRWLDDFEHAAEANRWTEREQVCYFPTFLDKAAMDWHISVVRPKWGLEPAWTDLRAAFIRYYLGDSDKRSLRRQLEQCVQKDGERATVFIPRVLRLMQLVERNLSEDEKVDVIRDKLRQEFRDKMTLSTLYTIEQLNDACLRIEAELPSRRQHEAPANRPNRKTQFNRVSTNKGQTRRFNARQPEIRQQSTPVRTCYRCERKGHISSDCRAKSKTDGSPCNERKPKAGLNCIDKEEPSKNSCDKVESPIAGLNFVNALATPTASGLINVDVVVNGCKLKALVDCGACCSVMDSNLVRENGWAIRREHQELSHAANGKVNCIGTLDGSVSVTINGKTMHQSGPITVVHNLLRPFILGIDFMAALNLVVDPGSVQRIYFAKHSMKKGVRMLQDRTLLPRSVNLLQTSVQTPDGVLLVMPFNFDKRIRVAHSLSHVKDGLTNIELVNLDAKPVKILAGTQVASMEKMPHNLGDRTCVLSPILPLENTNETVIIGDSLDARQLMDIHNLLRKHINAFSINGSLGKTDLIEHHIELEPGSRPFKEPVRRHPPLHVAEVNKQVNDMLVKNVIEPSSSPWASEYVVVKKKNGEYRICVDFRRLNNLTVKNSFPLPRIEDCLDNLNGNLYFTKLDFASGYWQLPVAKKSRPLTAFRTSDGLYQFKMLPFGLSNAPASFQALINMLFSGLKGVRLQVYLDDVCLASPSWEEHVKMLDTVLSIIERAGLKLRSSKCEIAVQEVTFLGHLITREGVRQDPSKMRALLELPAPTDVPSLRRVLGAFGYYRKFIFNFSAIVAPLTKLLCKNAEFRWGEDEEQAFNALKREMMKNATLSCPTDKDPIIVKTDASLAGIAGMALQQQSGNWKLLACCSRGLSPAERNYSITELEGLAAVDSIQKLRYLLLGRKFTLLVDHCALCILNKTRKPNNARLHRWALALSEFDFEVKYIKGSAHADVDCLSRAPVKNDTDEYLPLLNLNIRPVNCEDWIASYNEDDENVHELASEKVGGFYSSNGIIYKEGKLYIPEAKRKSILKDAHDSLTAVHDGIKGTLDRLRGCWWPEMETDIKSFVSKCEQCQFRKSPRRKAPGSMQPHEATRPMDVLSIDHLGKLPSTIGGKQFVLVAVDVFSRFVFARANEQQTAEAFKDFFLSIIAQFGPPRKVISDNHQAFCAKECKAMFSLFNIEHQLAAGRYHRGNAPVERTIQSLQEKLSLITTARQIDWEAALPCAVLTLNTKVCVSTNYAPYELMFGRPVNISSPSIKIDSSYSMFQQALQYGASDLAEALSNSVEAHEKAKKYYERGRPPTTFEVNDLVLVRVSDRAPKLSNKYEGPYCIISKDKDIYQLERVGNQRDKRMRHVSQLKSYNVAAAVIIAALTVESIQHLQEASPVFWVEDTGKFVSEGTMDFPYLLIFKSPCHFIAEYAQMLSAPNTANNPENPKNRNEIQTSSMQQAQPGQNIPQQIKMAAPPQQPVRGPIVIQQQPHQLQPQATILINPHSPQVAPGPQPIPDYSFYGQPPAYDEDELEELKPPKDSQGQWLSKSEMMQRQGHDAKRVSRQAPIVQSAAPFWNRCHDLTTTIKTRMGKANWHPSSGAQPQSSMLIRGKRQASFILGMIISDAISYVRQKLTGDSQSTPESLRVTINTAVKKMNEKTNVVAVATQITADNQKQIVEEVAGLRTFVSQLPSLEMFAEGINAELEKYDQFLDRLIISIKEGKTDTITMEQVFGTDKIEQIEVRDLQVKRLEQVGPGALKFYFHGHMRSENTKVYRVQVFSFFTNLTSIPIRNDYVGKQLLIFNSTADCVKAIDATTSASISDECDTHGFRDPTLKLWRHTPSPTAWQDKQHSTSATAWPHILVYCWGNSISVGEGNVTWSPCPTYVFKLNFTQSFRTSDNLVVHVAKNKGGEKTFDLKCVLDVHEVHFDNYESAHMVINRNLQLVNNLTSKGQDNVILEWGDNDITYKHATLSGLGFIGTVIVVIVAVWLLQKLKTMLPTKIPRQVNKHVKRQVQREVQEVQREVTIEMQQQVTTEVNRQLNAQLNRIVMDGPNQVVAFNPRRSNRRRSSNRVSIQEVDNDSLMS